MLANVSVLSSPAPLPAESVLLLLRLLHVHQTFVVTSHARPDGDAIGSALGMMYLLEAMGKTVTVCFADPIPSLFACLPGVHHITTVLPTTPPEAAILLECDSVARTGFPAIPAALTINIDHHLSGQHFADFNWIDARAQAVGAMIYELVLASGLELSAPMASCLYAALLTDTGSFTHPGTDAATFGIARHLLECGAEADQIAQAVYYTQPPSKLRLLGAALTNMRVDGAIAWSAISQHDIEEAGATSEDSDGIVDYLIGIAGVRAAAFLREFNPGNRCRLSLRSKGLVDVAAVAEFFGGGGHRNASGCTLPGPLEAATVRVLEALQAVCTVPADEACAPAAGAHPPTLVG